jgi:hypothetical protein
MKKQILFKSLKALTPDSAIELQNKTTASRVVLQLK